MAKWTVPVGWRNVTPLRWRVEFDRVGRSHDVPPLDLPDADQQDLVEVIYRYVRQGLLSSGVEVSVDWDTGRGAILCGFNNGGSFRVVDHPDHRPPGQPEGTPQ